MCFFLVLPRPWLRYLLLFGSLGLLPLAAQAAAPGECGAPAGRPLPAAGQHPAARPGEQVARLPPTGLLLHTGWCYHAGDDPTWARPGFDDSRWDTLGPSQPPRQQPRAAQAGVQWLRLRLHLSEPLRQRALLLQVGRLGSLDVYLNGRRLTAPADRARVRGLVYLPRAVEVPANGPAEQVLAMRFVPW